MRSITIRNEEGTIEAEVSPDLGAMVAALRVDSRDVLLREGGMPVLFPFAGRTTDDSYEINGARYSMPKHGFAKDSSFSVVGHSEQSLTLRVEEDAAMLGERYPFRHTLELSYRLESGALEVAARIENRTRQPMPHTLGWHPFFKASNRNRLEFTHHMTVHYDYDTGTESEALGAICLERDWDDVFCKPIRSEFALANPPDGYALRCTMDDAYQTIVVYTGSVGSVCIEPWCGVPDSINNKRMIQWIPPRESVDYKLRFHLNAI